MARRSPSLHISLIGAGKVGTTLALLLVQKGHRLVSVVSRPTLRVRQFARAARCHLVVQEVKLISPRTDFLLIATPDDVVEDVARSAADAASLRFDHLVVAHTSGTLTSDSLSPFVRKGAIAFSLHPIQTFPERKNLQLRQVEMRGVSYGIEGSRRAIRFAKRLVRDLEGKIFIVPKEKKILYHLACVFASNYSVASLAAAEDLVQMIGGRSSMRHFTNLIEASVKNAIVLSPRAALTGPIVRGDRTTIVKHLQALRRSRRDLLALYQSLGLYALRIGRVRGSITRKDALKIQGLLRK